MKRLLFICFVISCAASCGSFSKLVYVGQAIYFLPNGGTEVFDATYEEVYVNGTRTNENLTIDVGDGNAYVFHNIPYFFKGHVVGDVYKDYYFVSPVSKDGYFEFIHNSDKHYIPSDVYHKLKHQSNGNEDSFIRSLIYYVNNKAR